MKYIIILFLLVNSLLSTPIKKQLVEPNVAMELLESIKTNAIVLGNGDIEVHTFIDPKCKMSQRYLALLYKRNQKMFSKYTIYLYMHEIKSKKSKKDILNIMSAESSELMLRSIMLDKKKFDFKNINDASVNKAFNKVASVATKIGVYKRPYILINGKVK